MPDNFFAMLTDGGLRRITLTQNVESGVRDIFVDRGLQLTNDKEEIEFDGNYKVEEDEILFVSMTMEGFEDVIENPINIPILNLTEEEVRVLFWYEDGVFYFQNFDKRKLLRNKLVLIFGQETYNSLRGDAFILDNVVSAVHSNDKFYFQSYAMANKIFDLSEYYFAATNENLEEFGDHAKVQIEDLEWLLEHANSVIRKHVALVQKSKILDAANTKKIRKDARAFNVTITLDSGGKIIFPRDRKVCKEILVYLNEQYYTGPITGAHYRASSKRSVWSSWVFILAMFNNLNWFQEITDKHSYDSNNEIKFLSVVSNIVDADKGNPTIKGRSIYSSCALQLIREMYSDKKPAVVGEL